MTGTYPLIAVTSRRIDASRISNWLEPAQVLPTYYLDALGRAGALGVSITVPGDDDATTIEPAELLSRFDGLVISGGVDVDPVLYGQVPHSMTVGTNAMTDRWEISLLRAAAQLEMPLLAICRGAQLVNIAYGGTLHQHLGDHDGIGPHGIPNGGGGTPNEIEVEPGSRLAAAIGTEGVVGNCHHHQAVDRLGDGLAVVARTADGVIEAFEPSDGGWVVAVQWHPEDSAMHDPLQQRLFSAFVSATR